MAELNRNTPAVQTRKRNSGTAVCRCTSIRGSDRLSGARYMCSSHQGLVLRGSDRLSVAPYDMCSSHEGLVIRGSDRLSGARYDMCSSHQGLVIRLLILRLFALTIYYTS